MADMSDDWRSFLRRWSEEWADAQDPEAPEDTHPRDEEPRRTRWLGFPPASEERIQALEQRLGLRLPPSYRTFLAVSDGWRHAGAFVWLLAGSDRIRPHEDAAGLSEYFPGELDDAPTREEALLAGMWQRALQLDVESDAVYVLLDPGDVDDTGEWAVHTWAPWRASPPERHPSFRAFMEAMHKEFHQLQRNRSARAGREFVNATTRSLDASVEAARLDALAGRYERASAALTEAIEYGRPRATGLLDQIRRLLGEPYTVSFHGIADDPRYAPEVLPVLAAEHIRNHWDDSTFLRGAPESMRTTADESLRQLRDGTFRYTPAGPFAAAVKEAREQARWGETDAAWHTLRTALPEWRPLGPDHIAPVGLCADPVLGPLLTPERGRELLATPRAGQHGSAPAPAADQDPPGLAWLADTDRGSILTSYRFLLVEGVEPAELPGRIGADGATGLREPMTLWDARTSMRHDHDLSTSGDEAVAVVGRAGPGWSFALEPGPRGFDEKRFVSPAVAASRGARAVTVWSEPFDGGPFGHFLLSVTENGEETYGFTVRSGAIGRRGPIPAALDPDRLFPSGEPLAERLGERRALEALAVEFGVRLPRLALTRGRLHSFRTRPWKRPPAPGEPVATLRFVRHRP
ncbi:SMI1/KNR4 family protein [Streptomyces sp. MBT33]|uniref:SMI1/KNR4 family protein n=1 Tax=Streptomyces sp. MBT33 TaxID=1488363 RepID=UPI00190C86CA|nr:SMI1/KNR4 family protein [Streptomyces sp. MBT33]MBK3640240.1 SMI1/KNR4 family protein [Streptomyces sp. MBT33]